MPTGFYRLKVDKIIRETKDAVSIRLLVPPPLKAMFKYEAGQFLTFHAMINGEDIRRSYSVCQSPYLDEMPTVAVKKVDDGRMSTYLNESLKEGDLIEAMPPLGHFIVTPNPERSVHYVLFGGGSGITPLKSILLTILHEEPLSKVTLFYANRDEDSIIFNDALNTLLQKFSDRLSITHILDNPSSDWKGLSGMLSESKVEQLVKSTIVDFRSAHYFICGPGGLMALVKSSLHSMEIANDNIHLEYFAAVVHTEEELIETAEHENDEVLITRKVKVELYGMEEEIEVKPAKTILEAAQDAGMDPPFSCTVGVCTTCRAMLHKGRVKMDEREGLSDAEIDEGFILTCQSHPLTSDVSLSYE
jgi:ring-1,2-phenylacetyl-CoA epoxidase subunit PaaE